VPVKFFDVDKVQDVLPYPPNTYPKSLQGLLWMDQAGVYGYSSAQPPIPDYILSFGDTVTKWCPKTRTATVAPWGKSFTWFNVAEAYRTWGLARFVHYVYHFNLNEDFTHAQIVTEINLGLLGKFTLPTWLVDAHMRLQTPPAGACPPPPGATKEQVGKCALWMRSTTVLPGWPVVGQNATEYPVFQITDNQGTKIQPYFDAYVQWASEPSNNEPDQEAAMTWLGVDLKDVGGMSANQSFVGVKSDVVPGWNPCNAEAVCQNMYTLGGITSCLKGLLEELNMF
jgi:hypothetical protein